MLKPNKIVVTLLLLFCSAGSLLATEAVGASKTKFVPLFNALPGEIIPLIRPFLEDEDVLVGSGNQLIIKTSEERFKEVLSVIKRFDHAPRSLLITVIQGKGLSSEQLSARATAAIRLGKSSETGLSAHGHISQKSTNRNREEQQSIKTIDGEEAFIQLGSKQPLPDYTLYDYGNQARIIGGIRYHDVTSGFYVRPKLIGQQVRLEISPWSDKMSRLGGGVIDTSQARTVLTVKLGEWVELGGVSEQSNEESRGLLSRHRSTRKDESKIFIRVEEIEKNSTRDVNPPSHSESISIHR